jgi:hypothetical protein
LTNHSFFYDIHFQEQSVLRYENVIDDKKAEIQSLVSPEDIALRIAASRELLGKIENEYRESYQKTIAIFDAQPQEVLTRFDEFERQLLAKLKLKKTAAASDWDNSTARRKVRPISRIVRNRITRSKQQEKDELFAFQCPNGSCFAETEHLEIIPPMEEPPKEERPPARTSGRSRSGSVKGKGRGRASLGASGRGKTSRGDELDEAELLGLDVLVLHPEIAIDLPSDDDLHDIKNPLRQNLITAFQEIFQREMKCAMYERERSEVAGELNERMRVHAPRATLIDLNIGQARIIQVETRKAQLQKHFQQASELFNTAVKNIEIVMQKRTKKAHQQIQKLQAFVPQLAQRHSSVELALLARHFAHESTLTTKWTDGLMVEQEKELGDFMNGFAASNERFIKAFNAPEQCTSADEQEMCVTFFDRMNAQVATITTSLRAKSLAMKNEAENLQKKVTNEFEIALPEHKMDLELIEKIDAAQTEAKGKLETLITKTKQMEYVVAGAIAAVARARETTGDQRALIEKQFEKLDEMRIQIVKRAKVLSELKSKISHQPIPFALAMTTDLTPIDTPSPVSDQSTKKQVARPKSSRSSRPDSSRKITLRKGHLESDAIETLQTQVDLIGTETITSLTPSIIEYYNQKRPKFKTTRPEQIPPTVPECIEMIRRQWEQTIARIPEVLKECGLVLRKQVVESIETANMSIPYVWTLFINFYLDFIQFQTNEIQSTFNETLQGLRTVRQTHRDTLGPRIVDANNESLLSELIRTETVRITEEQRLITLFNNENTQIEETTMRIFAANVQSLAQQFLQLFDVFVLPEDLKDGSIPTARRLTLKQMLKEKQRRAASPANDANRPFSQKQWPALTIPFAGRAEPAPEQSDSSPSRKGKRRRGSELPEKASVMTDKLQALLSLETQIHRAVIIHRNQICSEYESHLAERLQGFKDSVLALRLEAQHFSEHWDKCLTSLRKAESNG